MTISIIIPVYNAGDTLSRCVDSVLAQSFGDFEVLLVDDGSTDSSAKICDEYAAKDSRVRVFHKENGGVSSARNVGLDHALGEWVCFCDADDFLPAGAWTEKLLAVEADMLIGSYEEVKADGRRTLRLLDDAAYRGGAEVRRLCSERLTHPAFHTLWGKFFRRGLLDGLRLDGRLTNGEDTLYLLRCLAQAKACRTVKAPLYCYCLPADYGRKHSLSVEEAIYGLVSIRAAYCALGAQSKPFVVDKFVFFREMCLGEVRKHPSAWYDNEEVRTIFSTIYDAFPLRTRLCYTPLFRGLIRLLG